MKGDNYMKRDLLKLKKVLATIALGGSLMVASSCECEDKEAYIYVRNDEGYYLEPTIVTYKSNSELFNIINDMEEEGKLLKVVDLYNDITIERNVNNRPISFIYVRFRR